MPPPGGAAAADMGQNTYTYRLRVMTASQNKPVHWVVRMNYRNRALSWAIVFGILGLHLADGAHGPLVWALLALQFLVYPHVLYWRARRAADPLRAELHNMLLDAFCIGLWLATLGFPLWITGMLGISVCMNLSAFRGLRGIGQALLAILAGAAPVVAIAGLRFAPDTGLATSLAALAGMAVYMQMFSQSAYTRARTLHETRQKLQHSEQALQRQIEEINALQARLTEQAHRDPLTGLYNRRYLDATMVRELARCQREGQPLCVMMIDIDHFKQINDRHGHQAGDEVLRTLAHLLQQETRAGDVACRYGGEEFLMLLPNMPLEAARQRAEDYRMAMEARTLHFDGQPLSVRLSIGIACYPQHASGANALIVCADNALYQAKASGRNRVVVHAQAQQEAPA